MKRLLILIVLTAATLAFSGCSDDTNEQSNYINTTVDPGSVNENCCGVTYGTVIGGVAPSGGRYYWTALMRGDSMVQYGEPVFVDEGSYTDVDVSLSVSYLDNIPTGTHRQVVFASEQLEDVGKTDERTMTAEASMQEVVSYVDSFCIDCCTNEDSEGLSRYSAGALKLVEIAEAAGARIQTRYGRLCGESTPTADTVEAQQNCWVGIVEHTNTTSLWRPQQAQFGWMHRRNSTGFVDTFVYCEIVNNLGVPAIFTFGPQHGVDVPIQDSSYRYELIREDDTTLVVRFDGAYLTTFTVLNWTSMHYVFWHGEIDGRETDMPGTAENPCLFENCLYKKRDDNNWWYAAFDNSVSSDRLYVTPQMGNRPDQWGIDYNLGQAEFWIWDEVPYQGSKRNSRQILTEK